MVNKYLLGEKNSRGERYKGKGKESKGLRDVKSKGWKFSRCVFVLQEEIHKAMKLWEENFDDFLRFLEFSLKIRRFIYTTNQLERLFKEVKRRLKVIEILPDEENADKILFFSSPNPVQYRINCSISQINRLIDFAFY